MFTVRASAVICCLITSVALHAQILTVNVIDRHTKEAILADSLRIEIPARSIDTVITTHRFGGWDPTVSVSEEAAKPLSYTWDGTSILGDGLRPFSQVQVILCDVLGRTIEVMGSSASSEGRFRVTPREPMPALAFARITDGTQVVAGRLVKQTFAGSRSLANGRTGEITAVEMIYVTAYRQGYFLHRDSTTYLQAVSPEVLIAMRDSLFTDNVKGLSATIRAMGGCGDNPYIHTPTLVTGSVSFNWNMESSPHCSGTPRRLPETGEDDRGGICALPDDPTLISISIYTRELIPIDDVDIGSREKEIIAEGRPLVEPVYPGHFGYLKLTFRPPYCTGRYRFYENMSQHNGPLEIRSCEVKELATESDYIIAYVSLY